jgi:hypothetical protein
MDADPAAHCSGIWPGGANQAGLLCEGSTMVATLFIHLGEQLKRHYETGQAPPCPGKKKRTCGGSRKLHNKNELGKVCLL